MKIFVTNILFLFFCTTLFAQATDESNVLGIWISAKREAKIEIYKQGDKLFGKIVWTKIDGIKDTKNPDATLKSQPLLGLVILSYFKKDGENEWDGGKIYDPENGKTYSCIMKFKNKNLELRGYVGISLFGRTSVWTRN